MPPKKSQLPLIPASPPKKEPKDIARIHNLADEIVAALGAGHTESVYHNAMKVGLQDEGFPYETERDLPITFRGRYVGTVRADLIVEKRIVIELKAAIGGDTAVSDAVEQCKIYMKETKITLGVVIVFPKRENGVLAFKWFSTAEEEEDEEENEEEEE
jgi:GxxExxY protein